MGLCRAGANLALGAAPFNAKQNNEKTTFDARVAGCGWHGWGAAIAEW